MGVTELVFKIRRITDHSISRIYSHWRRFWPDSLLTAYIGLFDRSMLPMSLIQVELALKQATSKLHTPVSMYQFDPI